MGKLNFRGGPPKTYRVLAKLIMSVKRHHMQKLVAVRLLGASHHMPITFLFFNEAFVFFKKMKRAGVSREDLLYFFQAVVRPILEYACQAWHTT